jgi:ketosteroid isomerase-like protein
LLAEQGRTTTSATKGIPMTSLSITGNNFDIDPDLDVSTMTQDELVAYNLKVVEAHFHNENPESVDKALALYAPNIVWEAPFRGQVYTDPRDVKDAYLAIFRTVRFNKTTTLRRYATENFVFDDQIVDLTVVGDEMPNLGFERGDRISMRLVHLFELDDGKITREIAYEMSRKYKGPCDIDAIPEDARVVEYPDGPHHGQW